MNCAKKSEFFTCITRLKRAGNEPKLTLILISCKEIGTDRECEKQVSHQTRCETMTYV